METYIVYCKTNDNGYITAVNSSAFLQTTMGWAQIDEGTGDKFHHPQGNYFDKPILTQSGVWRYRLVDGTPVECTQEELAQQERLKEENRLPTWQDSIEAQIMYTALMTDTILEEM